MWLGPDRVADGVPYCQERSSDRGSPGEDRCFWVSQPLSSDLDFGIIHRFSGSVHRHYPPVFPNWFASCSGYKGRPAVVRSWAANFRRQAVMRLRRRC